MPNGYLSIDLRRIDAPLLARASANGRITVRELPTSFVELPAKDPSRVSVLSWRWDLDPLSGASRNIWVAVRQAKQMGLDNLFVDQVSIDQRLTGDKLTAAVLGFSALYTNLPIIAAYDEMDAKNWLWTMRRLWILREVRALRTNPNKVVYVGHIEKQGADKDFGFLHMVDRIWYSSYTQSILYLLSDQIGMTAISDLRFIMPEHADILSASYTGMSRNDYLLTAAILSQVQADDPRVNGDQDLSTLRFERYTLVGAAGGTYDTNKDILLDGRRVATWFRHYKMYPFTEYRNKLVVERDGERTIFKSLGISDAAYRRYASREEERRKVMWVAPKADTKVRAPTFEVVLVNP